MLAVQVSGLDPWCSGSSFARVLHPPEKKPVNAVFSSLLAAFEMRRSSAKRSVAAAVLCVVGLLNLSSCQYMMCL